MFLIFFLNKVKKYKNKQTYAEEGRRKAKVRWMDIQEKKKCLTKSVA